MRSQPHRYQHDKADTASGTHSYAFYAIAQRKKRRNESTAGVGRLGHTSLQSTSRSFPFSVAVEPDIRYWVYPSTGRQAAFLSARPSCHNKLVCSYKLPSRRSSLFLFPPSELSIFQVSILLFAASRYSSLHCKQSHSHHHSVYLSQ